MHKSLEKIMAQYSLLPFEDARALWVTRAMAEHGRAETVRASLAATGLEPVADWDGSAILADGRAVAIVVDGVAYAATAQDHARRKAESFAAKKQGKAKKVSTEKPGESLTSVLCPDCKSVMAKSQVCPNCANGKKGFKILCICTECGHEVYL